MNNETKQGLALSWLPAIYRICELVGLMLFCLYIFMPERAMAFFFFFAVIALIMHLCIEEGIETD